MATCITQTAVRFLHNVAGAPSVDLFVNGLQVVGGLAYKEFTGYYVIRSGETRFDVKISGSEDTIATKFLNIGSGTQSSLIVAGELTKSDFDVFALLDDNNTPQSGFAHLRFFHGAAGAPAVDVYAGVNKIFSNVKFGHTGSPVYLPIKLAENAPITVSRFSSFSSLPPNIRLPVIPISVKVAGTNNTVVGPLPVYLTSGSVYTVVASGLVSGGRFPLTAVLTQDNAGVETETLVPDFNLQGYSGLWWQIGSIPQYFSRGCVRQTAEYTLLNNGIKVYNSCLNSNNSVSRVGVGKAKPPNSCVPAALRVEFNPRESEVPVINFPSNGDPNYLVHDTDYDNFAVVGSPSRHALFILARSRRMSSAQFKHLLRFSARLGYDINQVRVDKDSLYYN